MGRRKRFFYNAALLTAVGLLIKGVNLAFNAFISRKIGSEALGLYTLIGALYSFLVTFASSGINLTVTRLVAKCIGEGKRHEIPRIMRHSMCYVLLFSSFASIVLFAFSPFFASSVLKDVRAEASLRVLSFSLIPLSFSACLSGYFLGVKRIVKSSLLQVFSQGARIVFTVYLVLEMAGDGVGSACLALALSTTLCELLSLLFAFAEYLLSKEKTTGMATESSFRDISSMALPLAFSSYVRSALLTLEHVLIPRRLKLRGEEDAESLSKYGALHGMALPLILYPMSPLSSFSGLLVPEFAECEASGDKKRLSRICAEVIRATLTYSAPASVFIFFFSEELAYCVYSSYEAGLYLEMLAPVIPLMYLDHVTDAMLKGIGEQVYSMWVNISDSLLSVILIWFLIPSLGISGYGLVIILMESYNFLLSFIRLSSKIKFERRVIFSFFLPFGEAALAALLAKKLFCFSGTLTTPLQLVSKIIFSISVFVTLKYAEKFLHRKSPQTA